MILNEKYYLDFTHYQPNNELNKKMFTRPDCRAKHTWRTWSKFDKATLAIMFISLIKDRILDFYLQFFLSEN